MSAPPVDQQQQQQFSPPFTVMSQQQAYAHHGGRGSVGPVIAVLVVIAILGVIAGMIGRLCSGRRIMGHGEYDVEGWVERKCSSCIDGRVGPPPRPPPPEAEGGGAGEDIPAADTPPEIKVEARESVQSPRGNGHAHS